MNTTIFVQHLQFPSHPHSHSHFFPLTIVIFYTKQTIPGYVPPACTSIPASMTHAQSSIKYGNIPSSPVNRSLPRPASAHDDKARRKQREARKRAQTAGRLHSAKESTLDYKLGLRDTRSAELAQRRRPIPVSIKGWASIVEERIEVRYITGCIMR